MSPISAAVLNTLTLELKCFFLFVLFLFVCLFFFFCFADFESFQVVPPPDVTAKTFVINFIHFNNDPTHDTKNLSKDIVIVMDGSGSVGVGKFDKGKRALSNMIELEREGGNDTKYASVIFSRSAAVSFSFLPCAEAADEILKIRYPDGGTNTQAGLAEAKNLFEDSSSGKYSNGRM